MYESYYRLREKPFQIVPSPNYLYRSEKHQNALTYLEYGLMENVGFILLTGEVGCGKTTLIQYMLRQLGERTVPAVIFNTHVSGSELLRMILGEYELPSTGHKAEDLQALNRFLVDTYAAGRQALLIIDEAQNLTPEAMEEVRMLSNLQSDDHTLLQIMLVGQPELKDKLRDPALRQVAQRIAVRFHLEGLDRADTGRYIAYRLECAGGSPDLFTDAAVDMIYRISEGVPRSINIACQAALVYGYAEESRRITQDIVQKIVADNLGVGLTRESPPPIAGALQAAAGRQGPSGLNEASVSSALTSLDERLQAVIQELAASRNGALQRVTDLLLRERDANRELERKYAHLEARFLALKRFKDLVTQRVQQSKRQ